MDGAEPPRGTLQARQTAWVLRRLLIAGQWPASSVSASIWLSPLFVSNLQDEVVPLGFVGMPGWALVATLLTCSVAVLVYVVVARLLRVREISQAWSLVSEAAVGAPGLNLRVGVELAHALESGTAVGPERPRNSTVRALVQPRTQLQPLSSDRTADRRVANRQAILTYSGLCDHP